MNRCAAFFLLALTVGVFSNATFGQYEAGWTNPVAPNQDDLVTLFYDTSQGNGALLQEEPPCPPCPFIYIHTGVITSESSSLSDWQFVQNPWPNGDNYSEANSGNVLQPLGGTLHSFDFGGMTVAEFYGVPDGVEIQKLAFTFRNATGTIVGKTAVQGDFLVDIASLPPQPEDGQHTVHFRVNMVNEEVSPNGVHVAGDFQGWDPAATELTDQDGDMIYETTQLIDTSFSEITFKFINGNDWTDPLEVLYGWECDDYSDGNGNRVLALDSPEIVLSADEEGNPFCFSSCEECVLPLIVDFQVDATQLPEVSPDGIFVAGSFNGWTPTAMDDSDGDGLYTLGLVVPPGQHQWKFLNGNDGWENVPGECGADDGFGGFNRIATFDEENSGYACCFAACPGDACVPEPDVAPITFRINLNTDEVPEGSVPWIWGSFTGWQGGALEMTDADADGIWEVTQEVSGDATVKYKYSLSAPVGESGTDYIEDPGLWVVGMDSTMMDTLTLETEMCGIPNGFGGYDRIHVRSGEPEILNIVCWNRCGDCEPSNYGNGGEEGGPCILDADNNGVCDDQEIYGCTYPLAENFSSTVTRDDGSCIFPCEGVVNTNVFDWDGDYVVTVTDFLMMLSVYGDTDVDLDGVWDSGDDCVDTNACNYASDPSEPCAYIDILGICGGGCEADEDNDGICDDIDTCIGIEDECGVCNGPGPTEVVIEDITILYDSVYLPQLEEWYVYEFGADTTFSFTCAPSFSECGDPVSYQGYDYATVLIGEQCWFAENLRCENYMNGDAIPASLSDSEWSNTSSGAVAVYGAGSSTCYNYSPDGDACDESWSLNEYGRLYNWYAVDDARGLCPSGWHVPTDGEWMTLEMALGMSESEANDTGWRGTDQGTQMKTDYGWYNGGDGTNSSGFSGLPGGARYGQGHFDNADYYGFWWSSSPYGSSAWNRALKNDLVNVFRYSNDLRRGFSVRCVQDAE